MYGCIALLNAYYILPFTYVKIGSGTSKKSNSPKQCENRQRIPNNQERNLLELKWT